MRQRMDSADAGPGEVLVLDGTHHRVAGQSVQGPWRDDHQGRDRAATLAQAGVVLERLVEVRLAVQDRDADVMPLREERLELVGLVDGDGLEAGGPKLGGDGPRLLGR